MDTAKNIIGRSIRLTGLAGILGVALTLILLAYIVTNHREEELKEAGAAISNQSNFVAMDVERTLYGVHQMLDGLCTLVVSMESASRPISDIRDILLIRKRENPYLMDLLIVNAEGDIVEWSGEGVPPNVKERDYVATHLENPGTVLYVGQPLESVVHDGEWFFGVSHSIDDAQGNLKWISVAIVKVDYFRENYQRLNLAPSETVVLVSSKGNVYTRVPFHDRYVGNYVEHSVGLWNATVSGQYVGVVTSPLDGMERLIAATRVRDFPLLTIVSRTEENILQLWHHNTRLVIIIGLLLTISIIALTRRLISQLQWEARANERLEMLATTDSLTKFSVRRHFMMMGEHEIQRAKRELAPLSAVMIDVDYFKSFNDKYGHMYGDKALIHVSALIKSCLRGVDLSCRYGGEEFSLLLPDTDLESARHVADKIRQSLDESPIEVDGEPAPITASFGVARYHHGESLDNLLNRADEALYRAKHSGRNRVCISTQFGNNI